MSDEQKPPRDSFPLDLSKPSPSAALAKMLREMHGLGRPAPVDLFAPFGSLSIELPKPSAPPAPAVDVFGYWRGESGSMLCFKKGGTSDRAVSVTGTALNQKVQGDG